MRFPIILKSIFSLFGFSLLCGSCFFAVSVYTVRNKVNKHYGNFVEFKKKNLKLHIYFPKKVFNYEKELIKFFHDTILNKF